MNRARVFASTVLALVAFAGCTPAVPPAQQYATVMGRVFDAASNAPIAGATVSISVVSTQSDASGNYKLYPVPPGPYTSINATAANYQPYQGPGGSLAPNQTTTIDIPMTHS